MARLVGVTSRWYGAFERGQDANYSDEFLQRAAHALRMSEAERKLMFYLVGHEPPEAGVARDEEMGPGLLKIFEQMPWPVYVTDEAWNFLGHNSLFDTWFPWNSYVPNVMHYIFTYPAAQQQFVDWERDWAAPNLAQIRMAHTRRPESEKLNTLIETLFERSSYARTHWNSPEVYEHPDGDRHTLYVPGRTDPVEIEIVAMSPMRSPQSRVIYLVPVELM